MSESAFQILMLPFLESLKEGAEHSTEEVNADLTRFIERSDQERKLLFPANDEQAIIKAIELAKNHLTKAGLIECIREGVRITSLGKMVLNKRLNSIDVEFLRRLPGYSDKPV
jgi:restriction endonuclease Mrr